MKKAFIQLHIAVLLAGFTGVLGRLITLNEGLLVWYRLLLTSFSLWILAFARRRWGSRQTRDLADGRHRPSRKDILRIFGVGAIAALHWVTFYGSIKYS